MSIIEAHTDELAAVVERAWLDSTFRERLMNSPRPALAEMGVHVPDGVDIEVLAETDSKMYLTLPQAPNLSTPFEVTGSAAVSLALGSIHPCCPYTKVC